MSGSAAFSYRARVGVEQVDEGDAVGPGHLGHRGGVELEPLVRGRRVGQVAASRRLHGDRREQDQPRGRLAVVLLGQGVLDEGVEVLLERLQPVLAGERLVVAEEGEDDVGLRPGQPLVGGAEVGRAEAEGQFIAGEAEVADDELVLGKASLEVRLQPAVVLHPVGQGVADDRNMIARLDLDRVGPRERGQREGRGQEGEYVAASAHDRRSLGIQD